jgi:hypothetical protein
MHESGRLGCRVIALRVNRLKAIERAFFGRAPAKLLRDWQNAPAEGGRNRNLRERGGRSTSSPAIRCRFGVLAASGMVDPVSVLVW